jgi:TonB family protein
VVKVELDEAATPEFGLAVRAMLDSCRFNPARKKDGTPAYANVGIEYDFEPKGRSDAPVAPEGRLILRELEKKSGDILSLQDLEEPLKPVSRQPPTYPTALSKTMPAGDAEVEFFVDINGNVQLPHIKSSSAPEFGYAAVQAVAAWRFEAPKKGAKAVVVRATVPLAFEGRKTAAAQKP